MTRHKKHHGTGKRAQPPVGPGLEVWRTRIESLLASGKSRDAVEAAKQYLKHTPGPEAEALAVKAYTARIEALQASGMHREAQALGALVQRALSRPPEPGRCADASERSSLPGILTRCSRNW